MATREELMAKLEQLKQTKAQMGSGFQVPAGTTARFGKFTVPMNPKMTSDESSAIAADISFSPLVDKMKQQTKEGIFNSPRFGNVGRTVRQALGGTTFKGSGLLTSFDPKLQKYQGNVKSLQRYVFGEGGKNLTGTEKEIVMSLVDPVGKSDEQYSTDLDEAVKTIKIKSKLAQGGLRAIGNNGGF